MINYAKEFNASARYKELCRLELKEKLFIIDNEKDKGIGATMDNKDESSTNSWISIESIHQDLHETKKLVYDPCEFICSQPVLELESADYGACKFELNNQKILFRVAKITPTKIGQFVTLWKRINDNPIQPYDITDSVDLVVVSVRKDNNFGQFVFPKAVLCEEGVFSVKEKVGKLGIRVYPPWDQAINRQAKKTQAWQIKYFLEIPLNEIIDFFKAKSLYKDI